MKSEPRLEQLIFGVEIEFILTHPPLAFVNGSPETAETMWNRYVRQPLRAAGLAVDNQGCGYHHWSADPNQRNDKWLIRDDPSVVVTPGDLEAANGTFANGRELADMREVEYTDVEIASPIMTLRVECMKEIQRILEVVRTVCVLAPKSAGMHVHIGNNGNSGFSLSLIQNLAVLMMCFEEQLNQAVPYHRLSSHYCHLPRCFVPPESRQRRTMAWHTYQMLDITELIES